MSDDAYRMTGSEKDLRSASERCTFVLREMLVKLGLKNRPEDAAIKDRIVPTPFGGEPFIATGADIEQKSGTAVFYPFRGINKALQEEVDEKILFTSRATSNGTETDLSNVPHIGHAFTLYTRDRDYEIHTTVLDGEVTVKIDNLDTFREHYAAYVPVHFKCPSEEVLTLNAEGQLVPAPNDVAEQFGKGHLSPADIYQQQMKANTAFNQLQKTAQSLDNLLFCTER